MKKRYSLFRQLFFGATCVLMSAACRKITETKAPQDQLTIARVFADDSGAVSAMTGYYIAVMNSPEGLLNGDISLDAGLSSDELDCTPPYTSLDSFRQNNLIAENTVNADIFSGAYNLIFQLNTLLTGLAGSNKLSIPVKTELTGEVEFNRALLYFYLVNLYGNVPLVLGTGYRQNETLPRAPVDSVYAQVLRDLEDAVALLPEEYLTTAQYPGSRTRPNRAAALALMARVWLYRGQWAAADSAATAVIADAHYRLEPNPDQVFLAGSREAIWQLQPVFGNYTGDGVAFLPFPGGRLLYVLDTALTGSFEPGDQRALHWTKQVTYNGDMLTYAYKYKQTFSTSVNIEYEMVLRLAEQYLIRAEARVQEGDLRDAIADLNLVRARAGLPGVTATGTTALLAAIRQERRVELFTEWGHRWLDLKRWGAADAVLAAEKSWWQPYEKLYPIPAAELVVNPGMQQNPGY